MEIELKFLIDEELTRERLESDRHLRELARGGEMEEIPMYAVYFDSKDYVLLHQAIAFRVRHEGSRWVATLKWDGSAENGLHIRRELNVPVDEAFMEAPSLSIFKGSAEYEALMEVAGDRPLLPVMSMEFTRTQVQVDTGRSIDMLSYDVGEIRTTEGVAPISELEIELYSGDREDMLALGNELAQKYDLKVGNKSKFQRGLELLGMK